MVAISVIIAAYNVEKYISETLQSVCGQDFRDLEIIVINDGSSDGTSRIVDSFRRHDERVKMIEQPNGGVSNARNSGLAWATGRWILFVDGDDQLLPGACARLVGSADGESVDMVVADFVTSADGSGRDKAASGGDFSRLAGPEFALRLLRPEFPVAIWNKLIRRQLFVDGGIRFLDGVSMGEDLAVAFECACRARAVVHLEAPVVRYRVRAGSLIRSLGASHMTVTTALDRVEALAHAQFGADDDIVNSLALLRFYHVMYARLVAGRRRGAVHRKLYDWYMDRSSGRPVPTQSGFWRSRSVVDRFLINAYCLDYRMGATLGSALLAIRRIRSVFRTA